MREHIRHIDRDLKEARCGRAEQAADDATQMVLWAWQGGLGLPERDYYLREDERSVALRAEMETLMVLDTCPHPLDPGTTWAPRPVRCDVVYVGPASEDDVCRLSRPENVRGYANNARYHCQHDHACV